MKYLLPGCIASSLLLAPNMKAECKIAKPNVIIVLSDDQGYGDFSCHGNPVLKTPALDKLYTESVRFGNFHVAVVVDAYFTN